MSISFKQPITKSRKTQFRHRLFLAIYNLDRQTAKISALSSGNVGKYEF